MVLPAPIMDSCFKWGVHLHLPLEQPSWGKGGPRRWWRLSAGYGGRQERVGWVQFHFYPSFFPSQHKLETKAVFR